MKAHALIGRATFEPEKLKIVYKAFDTAWERIAPGVSDHAEAIAAARMKLAEMALAAAKSLEDFEVNGLGRELIKWFRSGRYQPRSAPYRWVRSSPRIGRWRGRSQCRRSV